MDPGLDRLSTTMLEITFPRHGLDSGLRELAGMWTSVQFRGLGSAELGVKDSSSLGETVGPDRAKLVTRGISPGLGPGWDCRAGAHGNPMNWDPYEFRDPVLDLTGLPILDPELT